MRKIFVIILFVAVAPKVQAQHQVRDWHCIRQLWVETSDGNVVVGQCVAALPNVEGLDAADEDTLTKLDAIRHDANSFNQREPGDREMMDAIRLGFGKTVGQLCQKHPTIVFAPLLIQSSDTTTLYGCKNLTAAPDK